MEMFEAFKHRTGPGAAESEEELLDEAEDDIPELAPGMELPGRLASGEPASAEQKKKKEE